MQIIKTFYIKNRNNLTEDVKKSLEAQFPNLEDVQKKADYEALPPEKQKKYDATIVSLEKEITSNEGKIGVHWSKLKEKISEAYHKIPPNFRVTILTGAMSFGALFFAKEVYEYGSDYLTGLQHGGEQLVASVSESLPNMPDLSLGTTPDTGTEFVTATETTTPQVIDEPHSSSITPETPPAP